MVMKEMNWMEGVGCVAPCKLEIELIGVGWRKKNDSA
jgi:hypothetical protein